jgi:coronin-1B/1C/6
MNLNDVTLTHYPKPRYYEFEADALYSLSEYKSSDPQRGIGFLPRRALNIAECEIARAFKVAGSVIEPIAFIVPRKVSRHVDHFDHLPVNDTLSQADSFQSDIFPPAPSLEPSLTAPEFFAGKSCPPKLIELDTGAIRSSLVELGEVQSPLPPTIANVPSAASESDVSGDAHTQYQAFKIANPTPTSAIPHAAMPAPSQEAAPPTQRTSYAHTSPDSNNDVNCRYMVSLPSQLTHQY